MATALFGGNAGRPQGKNLVEFRAGKMFMKGKMVHPDTRKGLVYVHQSEDELMHFCWKDRLTGVVEDDLIIFPDDTEFKFVAQCTTGRVYVLKFKSSSRRFFVWMQEPKTEKDDDYRSKVNEYLNNPPARGAGPPGLGDLGGAGGPGEIDIQNLLGNMTQQQLMQLVGGMGMGNMGNMGALSSLLGGSRPGSTQSVASEPPMRAPSTAPTSRADSTTDATPRPLTSATLPTSETPSETPTSRQQIQLAELQSILHDINTPGPDDATAVSPGGPPGPNLSETLRTETIIPILSNAEVQSRLIPLLPEGTTLPKTEDELRATVHSPQFQQTDRYIREHCHVSYHSYQGARPYPRQRMSYGPRSTPLNSNRGSQRYSHDSYHSYQRARPYPRQKMNYGPRSTPLNSNRGSQRSSHVSYHSCQRAQPYPRQRMNYGPRFTPLNSNRYSHDSYHPYQRVRHFLTEDELRATVHSPQFQQAVNTFGIALQSGQLGPLMGQFGLGDEVVAAASQGDLEAFVRAMEDTPAPTPTDTEMKEEPDDGKMDEGK